MNTYHLKADITMPPSVSPWYQNDNAIKEQEVIATSELEARRIAQSQSGVEQQSLKLRFQGHEILVWQSPLFTSCVKV